jgi:hypothetical protein
MPTFTKIETITVGSGGAATVTFSSIPATYTDLVLKVSARGDATGLVDVRMQFNGDTASNYQARELFGDGAIVQSNTYTTTDAHFQMNGSSTTSSTFTNSEIYISNYASSNQKTLSGDAVNENNSASTSVQARLVAWKWSGTAAISSILFSTNTGNYVQHSTFTLYGISNA